MCCTFTMPRQGRVFKKRPKGFHGSHKKKKEDPGPSVSSDIKFSDFESDIDTTLPRSSTSSEKLQDRLHEYSESEEDKYDVLNVQQISEMLKKIAVCKSCGGMLNFSVVKRIGYAAELEVLCMECMASVKEMSSEKMEESGLYHVNLRMCYAFRTIGKGFNGAKMFSAMANLPPPHSRFSKHEEIIESAAENVAMDSMKSAVEETVVCNDNSRDITVAVDGTWQKRGHSSLNGVVSVTSGETGKVLDVAVMSKFCRCPRRLHQEHEPNCVANYEGTSGGMEVQGAKEIFFRSEELYGVRYVKYLGDGDTKAFKEILAAAPYGPSCPIEKLECVGHVQKRMGTRLRNLKAQWGKKVLADGKSIGGKNRLTDKAILAIQNFYGLAIRRNTGDLEKMKKAIWAVFFHLSSSDAEPCHILCDKTWCKYLAATEEGGTYCHAEHTHIPRIIMEAIKPIFRDLANPKLIEKCLHGKTQNPNESFNNIIWTRVPKNIFVRLRTLKMGVYDAVSTFNDGNISRDDHLLMRWNLVTGDSQKSCELPPEVFPLDLHSFARQTGGGRRAAVEQLLLTSSDGRFHLIGKSGRIEKSVEAHKGAALVGRWSPDGSSLITGGEEGTLKVWSRSGMLRSVPVQGSGLPIYSADWSSDSNQILYTNGKHLVIKPLAPNSKSNRWKAHEGLILKVAWEQVNGRIISAGEDCRYKVWDSYGSPIFSSLLHEHPITSLAWSPSGDLFAVGSFDTLRLCDKSGWSHCLEKPSTGSLYSIGWSADGTQLAAGCANRKLLLAHVIGRRVEWGQYEAVTTGRKTVQVQDVMSDGKDLLEFSERVIQVALAYQHLVVVTTTQAYIYSVSNFNTPIIIDLREGSVSLVLLSERHLLLAERASLGLYSLEGRLLASPRWPSLNPPTLNPRHVSLGPETIAARDQADEKLVQLLELSGKEVGSGLEHTPGVVELGLSQGGAGSQWRLLAFIDKTRDLYIATVYPRPAVTRRIEKLGSIIQSFKWNSHLNIIAGMQDATLTIWFYPQILFVDKRMTKKTAIIKDASEFGQRPGIASFVENQVGIRRSDGALVTSGVYPYFGLLHSLAASAQWPQALRLARMIKDEALWSCLAAMATQAKEISTAEAAYAAISCFDRVLFIQQLKKCPVRAIQQAEMSLLGGNVHEAEATLLQNGLVFRAIICNVNTYNWERALEIALRHKSHIDTVLYYREKFMERLGKTETNEKFKQLRDNVTIDPDQVEKKVAKEYEMENEKV